MRKGPSRRSAGTPSPCTPRTQSGDGGRSAASPLATTPGVEIVRRDPPGCALSWKFPPLVFSVSVPSILLQDRQGGNKDRRQAPAASQEGPRRLPVGIDRRAAF